jgi:hypothetical protein
MSESNKVALGDAAEDQNQLRRAPAEAVQGRAGEGIEGAAAMVAAIIQDGGPVSAVDM